MEFRKLFSSLTSAFRFTTSDVPPSEIGGVDEKSIGKGFIDFKFNGHNLRLYGGLYRDKPEDIPGIKMAVEIDAPYVIRCDIADFSTPHPDSMRLALHQLLHGTRETYYVGCMGV